MVIRVKDAILIEKYRKRHKRCNYCRFHSCKLVDYIGDIHECYLKDKIIHFPTRFRLCKWFRAKW